MSSMSLSGGSGTTSLPSSSSSSIMAPSTTGSSGTTGAGSSGTAIIEDDSESFRNNPAKWYFDKSGMENTPSRRAGIDAEKELSYRQIAACFIQEMGQKLKVNQLCNNTAIVYMNRFYMFHSFTHFHRNTISIAAIFLAAKVEEQPRKLDHVVRVAHYIQFRTEPMIDPKSELYINMCHELVMNENVLLQTLGFDLAVDHPHTHIIKCCQLVRASKDLGQVSYLLATNILHLTTMCVQYRPTLVATLAIHVACKWSGWQIPRSKEGKDWWKYVDDQSTYSELEELTQEYLEIYDKAPPRQKLKITNFSSMKGGVGVSSSTGGVSGMPSLPPLDSLGSGFGGISSAPLSQPLHLTSISSNLTVNTNSNPMKRSRSRSPSPKRQRVTKPGDVHGASGSGVGPGMHPHAQKPHHPSSILPGSAYPPSNHGMKPPGHMGHGPPVPGQNKGHGPPPSNKPLHPPQHPQLMSSSSAGKHLEHPQRNASRETIPGLKQEGSQHHQPSSHLAPGQQQLRKPPPPGAPPPHYSSSRSSGSHSNSNAHSNSSGNKPPLSSSHGSIGSHHSQQHHSSSSGVGGSATAGGGYHHPPLSHHPSGDKTSIPPLLSTSLAPEPSKGGGSGLRPSHGHQGPHLNSSRNSSGLSVPPPSSSLSSSYSFPSAKSSTIPPPTLQPVSGQGPPIKDSHSHSSQQQQHSSLGNRPSSTSNSQSQGGSNISSSGNTNFVNTGGIPNPLQNYRQKPPASNILSSNSSSLPVAKDQISASIPPTTNNFQKLSVSRSHLPQQVTIKQEPNCDTFSNLLGNTNTSSATLINVKQERPDVESHSRHNNPAGPDLSSSLTKVKKEKGEEKHKKKKKEKHKDKDKERHREEKKHKKDKHKDRDGGSGGGNSGGGGSGGGVGGSGGGGGGGSSSSSKRKDKKHSKGDKEIGGSSSSNNKVSVSVVHHFESDLLTPPSSGEFSTDHHNSSLPRDNLKIRLSIKKDGHGNSSSSNNNNKKNSNLRS